MRKAMWVPTGMARLARLARARIREAFGPEKGFRILLQINKFCLGKVIPTSGFVGFFFTTFIYFRPVKSIL